MFSLNGQLSDFNLFIFKPNVITGFYDQSRNVLLDLLQSTIRANLAREIHDRHIMVFPLQCHLLMSVREAAVAVEPGG